MWYRVNFGRKVRIRRTCIKIDTKAGLRKFAAAASQQCVNGGS